MREIGYHKGLWQKKIENFEITIYEGTEEALEQRKKEISPDFIKSEFVITECKWGLFDFQTMFPNLAKYLSANLAISET